MTHTRRTLALRPQQPVVIAPAPPTLADRVAGLVLRGILWAAAGVLGLIVFGAVILTLPLMVLAAPILWPMVALIGGWLVARRRTRADLPAYISSTVDVVRGAGRRVWIVAGISGATALIVSLVSGQPASTTLQSAVAAPALTLIAYAWKEARRG